MRFSVAIPAYKPDYLAEAVTSVRAQSFADWELIIVDDCSPADLRSIVAPFLVDSRISYYRNEKNFGAVDVVDNWNRCLEYCTGDYVICMGDDDRLLPDCLEEFKKLIERYPGLGVYHAWTEIIDADGNQMEVLSRRPERETAFEMIIKRWNGRKQYIGDFCFDRILLRSIGGFYKLPLAWGSDDVTAFLAARGGDSTKAEGLANTSKVTFQYRVHPLTISSSDNYSIMMDAMMLSKEAFCSYFDSIVPKDKKEADEIVSMRKKCETHFRDVAKDYVKKDIGQDFKRLHYWIKHRIACRLPVYTICYEGFKGVVLHTMGRI